MDGSMLAMPQRGEAAAFESTRAARPTDPQAETGFVAHWVRSESELREAQRLRWRVFVEEMGARLDVPEGTPPGHDADRFDAYCEHLLVRPATDADDEPAPLIGTYRVLTPDAARRAGGLYSETEFDLAPLAALRARAVELGRSCVDARWRAGGAIMALWRALGQFMQRDGHDTMIGCASVSMRDGGHVAASLWARLRESDLAAAEWQVRPHLPLPVDELRQDLDVSPPPLIKGYLRCGAKLLGAPAWDPDFNTADLPLLVRVADMPARYRRHFFSG